MQIAFTICSNNFLGQAKTMLASLEVHNPEIKTFIFLVDQLHNGIDYTIFSPAEVVVVNELVVPRFHELVQRYTVMELNSSVRPFIFQYISAKHPEADRLYYFDADLYFYHGVQELDGLLSTNDIVITPHFITPLPIDGHTPFENLALNYGTYNLGFLALNPLTENVKRFLQWWGERTAAFAHIDVANGYFTDQIWFNLVPLFFNKVYVSKNSGYNMACWNLHERSIKNYLANGEVLLNSGDKLVFYHFSLWDFFNPQQLTRSFTRFNFDNRPDLVKLFADYHQQLIKNRMEDFRKIPCELSFRKPPKRGKLKTLLTPGVQAVKKIWDKL